MNNIIIKNILRFYGLIFLQVLIIDNVDFPVLVNPYIYPLFILLLPFQIPHWAIMVVALLLGLGVDLFLGTIGIHAAASVFTAFLRPYIVNLFTPSGGYETDDEPRIKKLGLSWFLPYSAILIFAHHLAVFLVETLSFEQILFVLTKMVVSSIIALLFIILLEYIFYPKN